MTGGAVWRGGISFLGRVVAGGRLSIVQELKLGLEMRSGSRHIVNQHEGRSGKSEELVFVDF